MKMALSQHGCFKVAAHASLLLVMPGVTGESSMRPWHGNVHTAASVTVPMLRRRGHAMIGSMAPAVVRRTDMRRTDMHGCMTATMNLDWIKMRRNIAASVMVASIRMMGIVSEQRAGRRKHTDGKDGDKAFHRFLDLVFFKWHTAVCQSLRRHCLHGYSVKLRNFHTPPM